MTIIMISMNSVFIYIYIYIYMLENECEENIQDIFFKKILI